MTPKEYKDFTGKTYDELGEKWGMKRSRAYDVCKELKGCLKLPEINNILRGSDGHIQPEDIGLEVC